MRITAFLISDGRLTETPKMGSRFGASEARSFVVSKNVIGAFRNVLVEMFIIARRGPRFTAQRLARQIRTFLI